MARLESVVLTFCLLTAYMVVKEDILRWIYRSKLVDVPEDYDKLRKAKFLPLEIQSLRYKADFLRAKLDSLETLTAELKMWKKSYFGIEDDRISNEHKIYEYQAENYNLEKANKELFQQIEVFVGAMKSVKALTRNADEEKRIAKIEGEKTEQSRLLPYSKD
ncbi:uncharacterized protein LOC115991742 [Quercus lobata]|uniref:uncharacterized protein LOC115991742 n=1 Tax=Quercus lobata TaxID=97700 RepID=UPI001246CEC3|nr:uncharacterized protein LOC115991742 [Quercus lobata]